MAYCIQPVPGAEIHQIESLGTTYEREDSVCSCGRFISRGGHASGWTWRHRRSQLLGLVGRRFPATAECGSPR